MSKRVRKDVVDRMIKLSDYLCKTSKGITNAQDWEIMEDLGYNNRKTLQRDLKRLEDSGYVTIDVDILTPVKVSQGSSKQYIKKRRTIRFKPSESGLLKLPKKRQPGDILGKATSREFEVIYKAEKHTTGKWMQGPDHTLILNPDYDNE